MPRLKKYFLVPSEELAPLVAQLTHNSIHLVLTETDCIADSGDKHELRMNTACVLRYLSHYYNTAILSMKCCNPHTKANPDIWLEIELNTKAPSDYPEFYESTITKGTLNTLLEDITNDNYFVSCKEDYSMNYYKGARKLRSDQPILNILSKHFGRKVLCIFPESRDVLHLEIA
jgi:hypothetical protein